MALAHVYGEPPNAVAADVKRSDRGAATGRAVAFLTAHSSPLSGTNNSLRVVAIFANQGSIARQRL
jgi:hypothetical protein